MDVYKKGNIYGVIYHAKTIIGMNTTAKLALANFVIFIASACSFWFGIAFSSLLDITGIACLTIKREVIRKLLRYVFLIIITGACSCKCCVTFDDYFQYETTRHLDGSAQPG